MNKDGLGDVLELEAGRGSGTYRGSEFYRGLEAYRGEQAREVIRYVREEYGDELEFLWQDENGVWRNPGNRKWYGVMMRVKGERLGLPSGLRSRSDGSELGALGDGMVEILDLRFEKGMAREFVMSFEGDRGSGTGDLDEGGSEEGGFRGSGILLGYHMNKNNWITVVLDYGMATEEVLALVDKSYRIVAAGE